MSIGNLKTQGNKGNNFPYQVRNLQLLDQIIGSLGPGGLLATEATALQILSSLQNGQEFEQNLVIDTGDPSCGASGCPTYLQVRIWDTVTHTFGVPRFFDAAGTEFFLGGNPLYGPMKIVNPQFVLDNILLQVTAINADLDVALSTRASEASNLFVLAELVAINAKFNSLGQKLMAGSVPVVLASDQSSIPVTVTGTSSATSTTVASVAASLVNVTLLVANASRRGATFYYDGNNKLYLKLGATASMASFTVVIPKDGYYEIPANYTGIVDGIWDVAHGSVLVTEILP